MPSLAASHSRVFRYGIAGCILIFLRSVLSQDGEAGAPGGAPGPDGGIPEGPMDPVNDPANGNQLPPRIINAQYEAISILAVSALLFVLLILIFYELLATGATTDAPLRTATSTSSDSKPLEYRIDVNIWDDNYVRQLNPLEVLSVTTACLKEFYNKYDRWKPVPPDFVVPNDDSWPAILRNFPLGMMIDPLPCCNRGVNQPTGIEKVVATQLESDQKGTTDSSDNLNHDNDDRHETWYELFYDLVFVAGALQLGLIIKYDHRLIGVFKAGVLFLILRSTWDHLTLYQNRFHVDDLTHVAYYTIQSMGAFVIALNLQIEENGFEHKWDRSRHQIPIAMTCTLLRIVTVGMYMKAYKRTSCNKSFLYRIICHTSLSGTIFALSTLTSTNGNNFLYLIVWILAILVEGPSMYFISYLCNTEDQIFLNRGKTHFIHRNGTFFMLILGEAVIQLVQASSAIFNLALYARELLGFAVVFNVGSVYYEQQMREAQFHVLTRSWPLGYVWIELQSLLSMFVLFYAVGVKLVFHEYVDDMNEIKLRDQLLMCGFASISLLMMYSMNIMHDGFYANFIAPGAPAGHHVFRFVMSFAIGVIPYFVDSTTMTVVFLFVTTTFLIIHDVLIRTARMKKLRNLLEQKGRPTEILTWRNAMDSTKRFMDDSGSSKHGLMAPSSSSGSSNNIEIGRSGSLSNSDISSGIKGSISTVTEMPTRDTSRNDLFSIGTAPPNSLRAAMQSASNGSLNHFNFKPTSSTPSSSSLKGVHNNIPLSESHYGVEMNKGKSRKAGNRDLPPIFKFDSNDSND